jgi:hypothetical protein
VEQLSGKPVSWSLVVPKGHGAQQDRDPAVPHGAVIIVSLSCIIFILRLSQENYSIKKYGLFSGAFCVPLTFSYIVCNLKG